MDVDGTLTDGTVYISDSGEIFKAFNVKDGCGIKDILPKYNIIPIIITARNSKMLEKRCAELGIKEVYQGMREKDKCLNDILLKWSNIDKCEYGLRNVAYIGDDVLDLLCMLPIKDAGGYVGCPNDSVEAVLSIADYICCQLGGRGAVREFIERIIR